MIGFLKPTPVIDRDEPSADGNLPDFAANQPKNKNEKKIHNL
jgi:hypothetical protein